MVTSVTGYPDHGFQRSVAGGENLIVADAARVVRMFQTAAEEKPTTESLGVTATKFNASPLVITLSFCTHPATEPMPILRFNSPREVFGVTGLEVDGSGLSLVDKQLLAPVLWEQVERLLHHYYSHLTFILSFYLQL